MRRQSVNPALKGGVKGLLGMGLALIVGWTAAAAAEKGASPKAKKSQAAESASASPAGSAQADAAAREIAEREKKLRDWRAKLAGTRWELELVLSGQGQPAVVQSDVLMFGQRSVGTEGLLKAGYLDSNNYALYSPTEESVAWEAMQLKDGQDEQDMVIWRGEIIGDAMQGTVTKQRPDKKKELVTEHLSFTGRLVKPVPEAAPPAAGEGVAVEASSAPAESPPAEAGQP
ncbi:MAG: hypothetical protein HYY58_05600 [Candidatus Omnitrophica bacterium]|nr:hypothetical protein [Candidatus Omnitrophota bacterium]MBI3011943.1 hypothetical protein [Candidatus Omnitrophota bacterium]